MKDAEALLLLARTALRYCLQGQGYDIEEDLYEHIPMIERGVSVVVRSAEGRLLGANCRLLPRFNLAEEIRASMEAMSRDERFGVIDPNEVDAVVITIQILSAVRELTSTEGWSVRRHGVIVVSDGKLGWILPAEEGIASARDQLALACFRGGIEPRQERVHLYCFEVEEEIEG
jgi:hypothetical protein